MAATTFIIISIVGVLFIIQFYYIWVILRKANRLGVEYMLQYAWYSYSYKVYGIEASKEYVNDLIIQMNEETLIKWAHMLNGWNLPDDIKWCGDFPDFIRFGSPSYPPFNDFITYSLDLIDRKIGRKKIMRDHNKSMSDSFFENWWINHYLPMHAGYKDFDKIFW